MGGADTVHRMTSPGSRVLDMAHGAASAHILGALAVSSAGQLRPLEYLTEAIRGQFRQLLDSAGWQLTGVTPLPSGQSILSARARPGTGPAPG